MFCSVAISSPFSPGSVKRRAMAGVLASGMLYLACGSSAVVAQQLSWHEWNADSENSATAAQDTRDSGPGFSDESVSELKDFVNGISATSSHKSRPTKATAVGLTRILEETPLAPQQELEPQISPPTPARTTGIWWEAAVQSQLRPSTQVVNISLESLLVQALDYSSQIKVYSDLPMIRQTSIVEAQAAFDPVAFLDSRWDDQNDPVGNTLTTGGASRYLNNQYSGAAGMRQRTQTGGKVEVAERVGFQNTNSTFFVPNPQGTSKLVLN